MKRLYTRILLAASVLLSTSCSDWLDLQPEGEATHDELYSTGSGYRTVLNGLYRNMGKKDLYGCQLQFGLVDCMSQQYDLTNSTTTTDQAFVKASEFNYNDYNVVGITDKVWSSAYNVIATGNDLLQNIESASPDLFDYGEMERDLIKGEALACRALLHFDLLRLFAPAPVNDDGQSYVPYLESYPNITASRIPVKEYLEKVIRDLEEARGLIKTFDLSDDGIQANSTVNYRFSKSVGSTGLPQFFCGRAYRLNYHAVTALLARVYQYAGGAEREKLAFDCASELINQKDNGAVYYFDNFEGITTPSSQDNLTPLEKFDTKDDLKARSSLIFSVYNEKSFEENSLDYYFKRPDKNNQLTSVSWLPVRVEALFGNELGSDLRATQWLCNIDGTHYISGKWYMNPVETVRDANANILPVIRLTEMVYIAAEYQARNNHFTEAYKLLNDLRAARKLDKLPEAGTWAEFQADLIKEARREWISEGQLFYLYKRLDAEVSVFSNKGEEVRKLTKGELSIPVPTNQIN